MRRSAMIMALRHSRQFALGPRLVLHNAPHIATRRSVSLLQAKSRFLPGGSGIAAPTGIMADRRAFSTSKFMQTSSADNDKDMLVTQGHRGSLGDIDIVGGNAEASYPFIFKLVQALLETSHGGAATVTPWWAVIVGSAVVLRGGLTLPVFIYQQRAMARAQRLGRVSAAWQHSMRASLRLETADKSLTPMQFQALLEQRVRRKHHELLLKQGSHPIMNFLLPLAQLPIWVSMTYVLRHLCGVPLPYFDTVGSSIDVAPAMAHEGILWFSDLTVADPTFVLPAITGALYLANAVVARRSAAKFMRRGAPTTMSRVIDVVAFGSPVLMTYIAASQPVAIVLYWATSAAFSLVQNLVFQHVGLRKMLKFPLPK